MIKSFLGALAASILLSLTNQALAADVALKDDHPEIYYVKNGDTLWDIASRFLSSPWQWPELWHFSDEIQNPHLIYPGDVIRLVQVDGQPRLVVDRGDEARTVKVSPKDAVDGVVKLSPQAREYPLATAVPAIPMDAIQSFLLDALVVSAEEISAAPYVLGGQDGRIAFGKDDTIFVRDPVDKWGTPAPAYTIYRTGVEYIDPTTGELLGYEALNIGQGRVANHQDEILTLRVTAAKEPLRAYDRVMAPTGRRLRSVFYPSAPDTSVEATIIRLFGRLNQAARNDVVVINKGAREGLIEGHVMEIMHRGAVVRDRELEETIELPATKAGTMILFNVFEKVAYGLIIESENFISREDIVRSPLALQD